MFSFRPGWSELSADAVDGERILCAIEVAKDGKSRTVNMTYLGSKKTHAKLVYDKQ